MTKHVSLLFVLIFLLLPHTFTVTRLIPQNEEITGTNSSICTLSKTETIGYTQHLEFKEQATTALTSQPESATTTGPWTQKCSMHQARGGLSVAVVNEKIYAIGGSTRNGSYPADAGGFVGTNEEYDPSTDEWVFRASMPTPRSYFAMAVHQNKIYCIGGTVGMGVDDVYKIFPVRIFSGVNEVYDPETDTWETRTSCPIVFRGLRAETIGDEIYVMNGKEALVYDIVEDSWSTKDLPLDTTDSISTVVNSKLYLLCASSYRLNIYDIDSDNWTQGASVPTIYICGPLSATTGMFAPEQLYVFAVTPYNSHIHTSTDPVSRRDTYIYNVESDKWFTGTRVPTYRKDFDVAVLNDTIYLIGGYTLNDPRGNSGITTSALNEQYEPSTTTNERYTKPFPTISVTVTLGVAITFGIAVLVLRKHHQQSRERC